MVTFLKTHFTGKIEHYMFRIVYDGHCVLVAVAGPGKSAHERDQWLTVQFFHDDFRYRFARKRAVSCDRLAVLLFVLHVPSHVAACNGIFHVQVVLQQNLLQDVIAYRHCVN